METKIVVRSRFVPLRCFWKKPRFRFSPWAYDFFKVRMKVDLNMVANSEGYFLAFTNRTNFPNKDIWEGWSSFRLTANIHIGNLMFGKWPGLIEKKTIGENSRSIVEMDLYLNTYYIKVHLCLPTYLT